MKSEETVAHQVESVWRQFGNRLKNFDTDTDNCRKKLVEVLENPIHFHREKPARWEHTGPIPAVYDCS